VDGTGSGSCPMGGFGISSVEPPGSVVVMSVTSSNAINFAVRNSAVHCLLFYFTA
jgi:hypothetical protein